MNRLNHEQLDRFIKEKFKKDTIISKQSEMVFKNFNPNKVKPIISFYQQLNRALSVAAVSLTVLLVAGTSLYFSKNGKINFRSPNEVITYNKKFLVNNEQLKLSKEHIIKEVNNKFVTAYLVGKRDVGVNLTSTYWNEFDGEFTSPACYKIDNIDKDVKDIFIGDIGTSGLPYIFLLMQDCTVEYVDLNCFYDGLFY